MKQLNKNFDKSFPIFQIQSRAVISGTEKEIELSK